MFYLFVALLTMTACVFSIITATMIADRITAKGA